MALSGAQFQQLIESLLDAFPVQAQLAQMVRVRLDKNLDAIALGGSLETIVFRLIQTAEAQGWTAQLLAGARESNPGNPKLLAVAQQFGLASTDVRRPELEKIIRQTNAFLDVSQWRTRLGEIETQVCRIEIATNRGLAYGTGFLLGPDVVMTNYHVMEPVIAGEKGQTVAGGLRATRQDVTLRFDYKQLADGTTLNQGVSFSLAGDWLIDSSPVSPIDLEADPKSGVPDPGELDYALLRVDGSPGTAPVGGKLEPGVPPRGFVKLPAQPHTFDPGSALLIMQHPQGAPLKLAIDTEAVIGANANATRVTYRTDTLPGSSGSPCFNSSWELVALHHSGDRSFNPVYNEGIPFSAIINLLEQRGLKGEFGEQEI
jgi:hypothetical protein